MKDIIIDEKAQQQFDERYVPEPNSGCWLWIGAVDLDGYGHIGVGKKKVKAHRLSVKLSGREIAGKVVRHKCDNPGCVNPDHLLTGSQADNVRDMYDRKRNGHRKGEKHHRAKLTDADVSHIRSIAVMGMGGNIKSLAKHYGVADNTIRAIATSKYRKL